LGSAILFEAIAIVSLVVMVVVGENNSHPAWEIIEYAKLNLCDPPRQVEDVHAVYRLDECKYIVGLGQGGID
jgi:hypothetical protein